MSIFKIHTAKAPSKSRANDDEISVIEKANEVIVLFADGATGVGNGKEAASLFVQMLAPIAQLANKQQIDIQQAFHDAEFEISDRGNACDTSGVWFSLKADGRYQLASVGNSEILMLEQRKGIQKLSGMQRAKPRIGNGSMPPMVFEGYVSDLVLIASKSVLDSLSEDQIEKILRSNHTDPAGALIAQATKEVNGKPEEGLSAVAVQLM